MARKPKARAAEPFPDPLEAIEGHLRRGQFAAAGAALLPVLERRAESGDRECALAAQLLRTTPALEVATSRPPDALSATLDRLLQLVQRQEEQISTLRALIEDEL